MILGGYFIGSGGPSASESRQRTVARPRSFALAAAELHLTASPISHQVARLESHLVCVCLSEAQICGT